MNNQTQITTKSLLLSIVDAAIICGIKPAAIRTLVKTGILQGKSFGKKQERVRYITRESLDNFINAKEA